MNIDVYTNILDKCYFKIVGVYIEKGKHNNKTDLRKRCSAEWWMHFRRRALYIKCFVNAFINTYRAYFMIDAYSINTGVRC